jgi:hypothetical protein
VYESSGGFSTFLPLDSHLYTLNLTPPIAAFLAKEALLMQLCDSTQSPLPFTHTQASLYREEVKVLKRNYRKIIFRFIVISGSSFIKKEIELESIHAMISPNSDS